MTAQSSNARPEPRQAPVPLKLSKPKISEGRFGSDLPDLPSVDREKIQKIFDDLADNANIARFREKLAENVRGMKDLLRAAGEVLSKSDDRLARSYAEQLEARVIAIVEQIDEGTRVEVVRALRDAVLFFYPTTVPAMAHIAVLGHYTGFLSFSEDGTIKMPVYQYKDGREIVMRYPVTAKLPDSGPFMRTLEASMEQARMKEKKDESRRIKALSNTATLTFLEAVEGKKAGIAFGRSKHGDTLGRSYAHDRLVFEFRPDGTVAPTESLGRYGELVTQMREADLAVPVAAITNNKWKPREDNQAKWNCLMKCAGLLRHVYACEKAYAEEKKRVSKEALEAEATASLDEVLFEGKSGKFFVPGIRGPWRGFHNVFFLGERNERGIAVLKMPVHLEKVLSDSKTFRDPGDRFLELQNSLGSVLRRLYGERKKAYEAKTAAAEVFEAAGTGLAGEDLSEMRVVDPQTEDAESDGLEANEAAGGE